MEPRPLLEEDATEVEMALLRAARAVAGLLSFVRRFAMDVRNQRLEFLLEKYIIVRAAQTALIAELEKRDPADRASPLIEPL